MIVNSAVEQHLREAIALAQANVAQGGRPFGALIVRSGAVIATGVNAILATGDPTAHAELSAIRAASRSLGSPDLSGCTIYASGQPCPMCLAAMRLAGISEIYYAYSNDEGAPYGLSTAPLYAELAKPLADQSIRIRHVPVRPDSGPDLYADWQNRPVS